MANSFFQQRFGRRFNKGKGLPRISTELDSVRAYQWEVHFFGLPSEVAGEQTDLTIAAKQISPVGYATQDIEVNRINDVVYYPGKPAVEEVTITFDNLYLRKTATALWKWFKNTYDPLTGEMTKFAAPGGNANLSFKANKMELILLGNTLTPIRVIELYGTYPKSWKASELNYSTNEFHTIEMIFRYDFMDMFDLDSVNQ